MNWSLPFSQSLWTCWWWNWSLRSPFTSSTLPSTPPPPGTISFWSTWEWGNQWIKSSLVHSASTTITADLLHVHHERMGREVEPGFRWGELGLRRLNGAISFSSAVISLWWGIGQAQKWGSGRCCWGSLLLVHVVLCCLQLHSHPAPSPGSLGLYLPPSNQALFTGGSFPVAWGCRQQPDCLKGLTQLGHTHL